MNPAMHALRHGAAWNHATHIVALRISGEAGFDLLDRVSPRPLYVRDAQMLHTLFLRDDGSPLCDVYVCVDDLDFVLLAEGITGPALAAWLRSHQLPDEDVDIADLTDTHTIIGLHGPYSWEVMADLVGPDVVGVAYMTSFWLEAWDGIGFRAGKTGEYGYLLLVPASHEAEVWAALDNLTEEFALVPATVDDLDQCSLENGFFSIRFDGVRALDPMRLQLGWRVAFDRDAPGAEALRASRDAPDRVTWVLLNAEAPDDATLTREQVPVGRVLHRRYSALLSCDVALCLVDHGHGWPGTQLDQGTTAAPPLLVNRSLTMDAQRHSFAGRDVDTFPDMVQP